MRSSFLENGKIPQQAEALVFGLFDLEPKNDGYSHITEKGKNSYRWLILKVRIKNVLQNELNLMPLG
jgi:hypothetical protein